MNILSISLSSRISVETDKVWFFPIDITLDSYIKVLGDQALLRSFGINFFVTIVGTVGSMIITSLMAYSLSRNEFFLSKHISLFVVFTMIFQAPVIPFFFTVKALGMLNTVWALIIPLLVNAFNLIIIESFFIATPESLIDSGKIDGCGDLRILFNIMLPISKPVLATIGLFYAVQYWNIFYNCLLFISNENLWTLQMHIRALTTGPIDNMISYMNLNYNIQTMQMAQVVLAMIPVLALYPFLQKYFIAGVTLGALKE